MVLYGVIIKVSPHRAIIRRKHQILLITFNDTLALHVGDRIKATGRLYEQHYLTDNLQVNTIKALSVEHVTIV